MRYSRLAQCILKSPGVRKDLLSDTAFLLSFITSVIRYAPHLTPSYGRSNMLPMNTTPILLGIVAVILIIALVIPAIVGNWQAFVSIAVLIVLIISMFSGTGEAQVRSG